MRDDGYYFEFIQPINTGEVCDCEEKAVWEVFYSGNYLGVQRLFCKQCLKEGFVLSDDEQYCKFIRSNVYSPECESDYDYYSDSENDDPTEDD